MVIATLSTSHFEFVALGVDHDEAAKAMVEGFKRHRAQYPRADAHFMHDALLDGEVRFTELTPGGFARDGEAL